MADAINKGTSAVTKTAKTVGGKANTAKTPKEAPLPKFKRFGKHEGSIGPAEFTQNMRPLPQARIPKPPKPPPEPKVYKFGTGGSAQTNSQGGSTGSIGPREPTGAEVAKQINKTEPKIKSTPSAPSIPKVPSGSNMPKTGNVQSIGNNGSLVLLLSAILYCFVFYGTVVSPVWNTIWDGKPLALTSSQSQSVIGGLVFVTTLTVLGSLPATSTFALVFVLGLWAVFGIMNGTGQLSAVTDWLSGVQTKPAPVPITPGGGSGTAPPQKCPANTVYDPTKKQCVSTTGQ